MGRTKQSSLLLIVSIEQLGEHAGYNGQQVEMIKDKRHASRVSATRGRELCRGFFAALRRRDKPAGENAGVCGTIVIL